MMPRRHLTLAFLGDGVRPALKVEIWNLLDLSKGLEVHLVDTLKLCPTRHILSHHHVVSSPGSARDSGFV